MQLVGRRPVELKTAKAERPACWAVVRMEKEARIEMTMGGRDTRNGMIVCMMLHRGNREVDKLKMI